MRPSALACALGICAWSGLARADDAGVVPNDGGAFAPDADDAAPEASAMVDADTQPDAAPIGANGWKLTFGDEFDGTAIDLCKWQFRYKWGPAEGKIVNRELQAYVSQADANQAFTLDNGILHIIGRKQPGAYAGRTLAYTSGLLVSLYEQKYGFFETRSRMPKGSGLWPAFWLLHALGYPDIHEIDILEWISPAPTTVTMTDHYGTNYAQDQWTQFIYRSPDVSDAFHTYGIDWEQDRIVFYVDGSEIGRITEPTKLHDTPMYVITNLAIGGTLPGSPSLNAVFPASYDIDFIRVYQRDGSNPSPLPPSDGLAAGLDAGSCLAPVAPVDMDAAGLDSAAPDYDAGDGEAAAAFDAGDAGPAHSVVARPGCACSVTIRSATSLFVGAAAIGGLFGLGLVRGRRRRAR